MEADNGNAIHFDSAPYLTLKPVVWSEDDEDEGGKQITYTLPSYGKSPTCQDSQYELLTCVHQNLVCHTHAQAEHM